MTWGDFKGLLPLMWPVAAALGLMAMAKRDRTGSQPIPPMAALAGLGLSMVSIWALWPTAEPIEMFGGAARLDSFGLFLAFVSVLCAAGTVLLSIDYLKRREKNHPEFYVLVLFAVTGMMLMGMTRNLLTLLLGLEVMSLSFYVLAGFFREDSRSIESSIKYYLTGSFATGLLLFGIGLIFGGCGSLDLAELGASLQDGAASPYSPKLVLLGVGFMFAGFAFKIAAVPFHMWLPDVYEGAPTTVTGFMATGVKVAAFGALIRVFSSIYQGQSEALRDMLWWMALTTMTVGNVAALAQSSVKRMLAYSSIAHAGYLLVAIVVMTGVRDPETSKVAFTSSESVKAILFYLLAYAISNLGAFGILSYLERERGDGLQFDQLAGLRAKEPFLALALTVFMLSLAGIPGTAGFMGKYIVFGAAVDAGIRSDVDSFVLLAILGILNSLVGLYYYLRVPIQLYVRSLPAEAAEMESPPRHSAFVGVIGLTFVGVIWLGIGPNILGFFGVEPALEMVGSAMESLK